MDVPTTIIGNFQSYSPKSTETGSDEERAIGKKQINHLTICFGYTFKGTMDKSKIRS